MDQNAPSPSAPDATAQAVRQLASFAALPLRAERELPVASILETWVRDANELSRKMSNPAYQTLLPITTFNHPLVIEE